METCLKWYFPMCILNVARRELLLVRGMLWNPFSASNLEYVVESANLCVIYSNVGALWFSSIMALLRSFGSRHILRVSLALWGFVSELTVSVDSNCGVMISCIVISLSWVSIPSFAYRGKLCLLCFIGRMFRSTVMEYSPGKLPIMSKESRNMLFRSLILWRVLWLCNGRMVAVWS